MSLPFFVTGDKPMCCGCKACAAICPVHAISFKSDEEGFDYPQLDADLCIQCGLCEKVCPIESPAGKKAALEAYAAVHKNEKTLHCSSSGGAFTALAECVIKKGGVVIGAALKDNKVFHTCAHTAEELAALRGSKYVQSDTKDAMLAAKQLLEEEKLVLFSGTPCQCAAVRKLAGENNDCLLTMDVVCHGVPSPAVFEDYIHFLECEEGDRVDFLGFRAKLKNQMGEIESYSTKNGTTYRPIYDSKYLTGFMRGYLNRPSCYSCPYATQERSSDITVCDYWEYEKYHADFDPVHGISAVIVNTARGKKWFAEASRDMNVVPTTVSNISAGNGNLIAPTHRPPERDAFYSERIAFSFNDLASKYFTDPLAWKKRLIAKIPRPIKKTIKKIIG